MKFDGGRFAEHFYQTKRDLIYAALAYSVHAHPYHFGGRWLRVSILALDSLMAGSLAACFTVLFGMDRTCGVLARPARELTQVG